MGGGGNEAHGGWRSHLLIGIDGEGSGGGLGDGRMSDVFHPDVCSKVGGGGGGMGKREGDVWATIGHNRVVLDYGELGGGWLGRGMRRPLNASGIWHKPEPVVDGYPAKECFKCTGNPVHLALNCIESGLHRGRLLHPL